MAAESFLVNSRTPRTYKRVRIQHVTGMQVALIRSGYRFCAMHSHPWRGLLSSSRKHGSLSICTADRPAILAASWGRHWCASCQWAAMDWFQKSSLPHTASALLTCKHRAVCAKRSVGRSANLVSHSISIPCSRDDAWWQHQGSEVKGARPNLANQDTMPRLGTWRGGIGCLPPLGVFAAEVYCTLLTWTPCPAICQCHSASAPQGSLQTQSDTPRAPMLVMQPRISQKPPQRTPRRRLQLSAPGTRSALRD